MLNERMKPLFYENNYGFRIKRKPENIKKKKDMAVVTPNTRSHTHNQTQKRILSRNKGVKIKASVNCKMEIPNLNFPTGLSIGSLTGVMSEKTPSNIIFETPAQIASKKDKETKKKVLAPANNTTAYRKSMRLLIRNSNTLAEKYSSGVPYPFEMPRTVELLDTDPTKVGSENLKGLYLAGLGLYQRPDDRGMRYQRQLLQDECENFVNSQVKKDISSSSEETIDNSQVNIDNTEPEIASPVKTTNKSDEENKLKWKKVNSNWDVNMTVVITPVSQSSNNDYSQISSSENNLESDLETGSFSDCNNKSSNADSDDDDGWQNFGSFIEAQISEEIIVKPKCSKGEIEEAKMKIANMTKEWNIFLKGP